MSSKVPFYASAVSAVLAFVLFGVSLMQVPVTKFPTATELPKLEQLVEQRAAFSAEEQRVYKRAVNAIRYNNTAQLDAYLTVHKVAVFGFLSLGVAACLAALWYWREHRNARPGAE